MPEARGEGRRPADAGGPGALAVDETVGLLRAWARGGAPPMPRTPLLRLIDFARTQKVVWPVCEAASRAAPAGAARLLLDPPRRAAEAEAERRLATLRFAAKHLNAAGIEPVALKGIAFAARAGGPMPWRRMADVDVLIPTPELRRGLSALRDAGWRGPDGAVHLNIRGCYAHPTLFHPEGGGGIEVHVRCSYEAGGALGGMAGRARPSPLPGILLPTPEDRLAHMIHHSQIMGRGWRRRATELRDALDWRRLRDDEDPDLDLVAARFDAAGNGGAFRAFAALMARVWEEDLSPRLTEGGGPWAEETLAALADPARLAAWRKADYGRAAAEFLTRRGMLNEYVSRLLVKPHRDTTLPRIGAMLRRLATGSSD